MNSKGKRSRSSRKGETIGVMRGRRRRFDHKARMRKTWSVKGTDLSKKKK